MPPVRTDKSKTTGSKRSAKRQAYHLTCSNCRNRKVKCDGKQPECGICSAYNQECHYDKAPPMSQVLAMADRIAQLERLAGISGEGGGMVSEPQDHAGAQFEAQTPSAATRFHAHQSPVETVTSTSQKDTPHYPSTSAVEDPITGQDEEPAANTPPASAVMPTMNEDQLHFWEAAAVETCAAQLRLGNEKMENLLRTHWTWVHPMFMFTPRVPFTRDAASGGRNYSELLLCVICLHSTRFTDHSLREELLGRVRLLLGHELHRDMSIPTIQALLQLSARDMGKGTISRAWLYSGMGFRMAVDKGIFTRHKGPTADLELERVRQQLAWSCYAWDKVISLYLGRVPTLPDVPDFDPPTMDEIGEDTLWAPYGSTDSSPDWPAMPAHLFSTFANFCKLTLIIQDILITVYAKGRLQQVTHFVHQTRRRLEEWYTSTPPHLKVPPNATHCAPPHITTQQLLYFTTLILLHRPFRSNPQCQTICRDAAKECERLILLFERAFGLSHVTYLMAYCAYTAATVALQDLHDGIEGSQMRVNVFLRALYGLRSGTPGIQRSIDIIVRNLDRSRHADRSAAEGGVGAAVHQTSDSFGGDRKMNGSGGGGAFSGGGGGGGGGGEGEDEFSLQALPYDALPAFPFDANCDLMNFSTGDMDFPQVGALDSFAYSFATLPNDGIVDMYSGT